MSDLTAQDVTNILTALLGVATVWLAVATQIMAKSAKQSIELETIPYFTFQQTRMTVAHVKGSAPDPNYERSIVRLGIEFRNPSKVRISYRVKSLRMTLNTRTVEHPEFKNDGGFCYPGDTTAFWYGAIEFPGGLQVPAHGTADFEVEYWSTNQKKPNRLVQRIEYNLMSEDPPYVEWLNVSEKNSI